MKKASKIALSQVSLEKRIYLLRGEKVMLSTDLARLYQVAPKVLVQAVKRNSDRFPEDFMFQLSDEEFAILKSQIVTSSWGVFGEHCHTRLLSKESQCYRAYSTAGELFR
jgi:hypothetical protein